LTARARDFGNPLLITSDGRAGGDMPEILLRLFAPSLSVDVAGQDEHGVGRAVISLEPGSDLLE